MKNQFDWLIQLRRCKTLDTLSVVSERAKTRLTSKEKEYFQLAEDHRKAEIIMNKLYDHIPVSVWKLVK